MLSMIIILLLAVILLPISQIMLGLHKNRGVRHLHRAIYGAVVSILFLLFPLAYFFKPSELPIYLLAATPAAAVIAARIVFNYYKKHVCDGYLLLQKDNPYLRWVHLLGIYLAATTINRYVEIPMDSLRNATFLGLVLLIASTFCAVAITLRIEKRTGCPLIERTIDSDP
jgi:hypothetical protein